MVPIPEGVERDEEEPTGDLKYHVHSDIVLVRNSHYPYSLQFTSFTLVEHTSTNPSQSDGGDESRAKAAAEIPGALASMSILRNTKSSRILKAGENDDEIRG